MKIISAVVNNPLFIEIQYKTLQRYFKGEFELIIFNDGKAFIDTSNGGDITMKKQISDTCKKLGLTCITVDNDNQQTCNMSERHSHVFNNYILPYQRLHPDPYLLLDSDMFLVDDFYPQQYLSKHSVVVPQYKQIKDIGSIYYIWPGLCFMDFRIISHQELLDWNCCPGLDTGGMMKNWLVSQEDSNFCIKDFSGHQRNKIYGIKHLSSCSWNATHLPKRLFSLLNFLEKDPRNKDGNFFCELYDDVFLHYRAGSNWIGEGMTLHQELSRQLYDILI